MDLSTLSWPRSYAGVNLPWAAPSEPTTLCVGFATDRAHQTPVPTGNRRSIPSLVTVTLILREERLSYPENI